jgi:protein tyrosine/serine phosphatase
MVAMVFGLIRRRSEWKAAIAADARRLIESFHDRTYFEARERVRGRCLDGARPARYWAAVELEIARRQGIAIGLIGADMRG